MQLFLKDYNFIPDRKFMGEKIKERRNELGLTVAKLADEISEGLPEPIGIKTLEKWIKGDSFPRIDSLTQLSKVLKIKIDDLLIPNYQTETKPIKTHGILKKDEIEYIFSPNGEYNKEYNEIYQRFDYLLQKAIFSFLSLNEKQEIEYFNKHYLILSDYGKNVLKDADIDSLIVYLKNKYGNDYKVRVELRNKIAFEVHKIFFVGSTDINKFSLEPTLYNDTFIRKTLFYNVILNPKCYSDVKDILTEFDKIIILSAVISLEIEGCYTLAKNLIKEGIKISDVIFLNGRKYDEYYLDHKTVDTQRERDLMHSKHIRNKLGEFFDCITKLSYEDFNLDLIKIDEDKIKDKSNLSMLEEIDIMLR